MRRFRSRGPRPHAPAALILTVLAALATSSFLAWAQPADNKPAVPFWQEQPKTPSSAPAAPVPPAQSATTPARPSSPVIARVSGHSITQADYDLIAVPYFKSLKTQYGPLYSAQIQKIADYNVLDELLRRQVIQIESQRLQTEVSQGEIDALLAQNPYFFTNGTFDPAKLDAYKRDTGSNYHQLLPAVREMAAMNKLDESLRQRFKPTPAEVRAEWAKRNDLVRFEVLPLLSRDITLEPVASEEEWAQYYQAHSDQFMRRTRVRLRYVQLPLPAEGDSARAGAEAKAMTRARAIADSLRSGALPDSAVELFDTGAFEIPAESIPGLGTIAGLREAVDRTDTDASVRVVGPFLKSDGLIVGVVTGRQPKHVAPMREVLAEVRRLADVEKVRTTNEADRRAFFEKNRARWSGPRASLTRVTLRASAVESTPPTPQDVDRWYARHGHSLFGMGDSSRAWIPPLTDSLRTIVRSRLAVEQRDQRMGEATGRIVAALRSTRDLRTWAAANGAAAETLTLAKFIGDTLFQSPFTDSLLASAAASRGALQGPRLFGRHWVVWRVDRVDPSFVPTYESMRGRSDSEYNLDRQVKEEADGRAYFEKHRAGLLTPYRYAIDYVLVRIPSADSVRISESDIRRQYDANPNVYRQEEQVSARHILFVPGSGPDGDRKAHARADSLLAAIRKSGGDFADLARRFSQETGAENHAGDLGWFGRGRMVKEFEAAAFALKPGEISPVVKTQFGYHLIKVEDHKAAGQRPFAEVRDELRLQMATTRADSTARRSAAALRRRLVLGGDAGALARPFGGLVTSAPPISATDAIESIGFAQGLTDDLPGLTAGRWAPRTYSIGRGYLVVRLRQRIPPRQGEYDEVRTQAIEDMKSAKRRALMNERVEAIRSALAAGASLDSVAAPWGGLLDSGLLGQSGTFVPLMGSEPRVVQKAFTMKPGERSDTLQVAQGVMWMRIKDKKTGSPDAFKAASAPLANELMQKKYDQWVDARKKSMKIEILRADLKGPRPAPPSTMVLSSGN
jgi:parvulin-like peptidyl-prolyl isomerase